MLSLLVKPLAVVPSTWKDNFKMCIFTLVLQFLKFEAQGPLTQLSLAWGISRNTWGCSLQSSQEGGREKWERQTGKGERWGGRERYEKKKGTEIERKGPWTRCFFIGPISSDSLLPTRPYIPIKLSYYKLINGLLKPLIRTVTPGSNHFLKAY